MDADEKCHFVIYTVKVRCLSYSILEIKHEGLGSKIRDMEAFIGEHLDCFSFLLVSRIGTMG